MKSLVALVASTIVNSDIVITTLSVSSELKLGKIDIGKEKIILIPVTQSSYSLNVLLRFHREKISSKLEKSPSTATFFFVLPFFNEISEDRDPDILVLRRSHSAIVYAMQTLNTIKSYRSVFVARNL